MAILGHSKFIPVFLGKIIGKKLEQPFLAILNLYHSFWEKMLEKIQNGHFWLFQIYTSLFGKNCQKKFRMAIFGKSEFIPVVLGKIVGKKFGTAICWSFQIYTKNCWKKFRMGIFGYSEFIPVFLGKIVGKNSEWAFLINLNLYQSFRSKLLEKIWNGHFWTFQIYTSLFRENCQKKFGMAIFWHSKFFLTFFLYISL